MRARPRLSATLAVAALLAGACGGDDDDVTASTTTEATTTTTTSSTTTTTEPDEDADAGDDGGAGALDAAIGDADVDPEGVPADYLTYGTGAFPVRFDAATQQVAAAAILDGRLGYAAVSDLPTGPEAPITVTVEVPAPTTFTAFAVPPMSSFGCCAGTHIDTVLIEGSSSSPDGGYETLAEFQVEGEEYEDEQVFPADTDAAVRWIRVTLSGRQDPDPDDYRGTAFTELLGYGTQDPVDVPDGTYTGRWLTGGGGSGADGNRMELIQTGNLVVGCGVTGGSSFTISGGIENGLLRYVVENDTLPVVARLSSEGELVGALIGRSYTRLIGTPGGDPTPCTPGPEAPPNPVAEALADCRSAIVYGINFDVDRAEIRPDAEPSLNQILAALTERSDISVVIEGHTDADGSDAHNEDLSGRRAESVVGWLTERGVDAGRLSAVGKGESEPIADNETTAGKAANRRVEVEPAC